MEENLMELNMKYLLVHTCMCFLFNLQMSGAEDNFKQLSNIAGCCRAILLFSSLTRHDTFLKM